MDVKNASKFHIFKNKKRKWGPEKCHGDLCQPYVSNLAFVNWCNQDLTKLLQE